MAIEPTETLALGTPARPASVAFILVTIAIDALGFGIVIPVIPTLVVDLAHLTASAASIWVGALLATFSALQFLCAPVLGALSDRYGRRPVVLVSLTGVCANYLLLAWEPTLIWLFVGRVIAGATAANISAATAFIADVTPPAKRAQRFGLIGAMFGLGFVLGPAIGGLLGGFGLRIPFLAAAALAALNTLYGVFVLPESLPKERRRAFRWRLASPIGSLHAITADRAYQRLAAAWCRSWAGLGALQSSFVLANSLRFGWGTEQNGAALAAMGVGTALVQGLLVRRAVPWLGERRAAMTGYALASLAYLLFAFAWSGWVVYAAIVIQSMGAISGPAVQAMVSVKAGADGQGQIQGALASLQGLTAIIAPLAAGWIFGWFTAPGATLFLPGMPFLVGAVTYLLALDAIRRIKVSQADVAQPP